MYQFYDSEGNLTSNPGFDSKNMKLIFNTDPTFYGGIQNSIAYKSVELDFLTQFVKQRGTYDFSGGTPPVMGLVEEMVMVTCLFQS